MAKAPARKEPVRLSFDPDGQFRIEDKRLLDVSAEKAAEACPDAVRTEPAISAFEARFLRPLHDWCARHADRVAACFVPLPSGHIRAFIVTTSPRFDFALAEELAALERQLAGAGWRVGLSQLPAAEERSLATFFNPEGALEVYAQREPASE
jgi:hypothetical protein